MSGPTFLTNQLVAFFLQTPQIFILALKLYFHHSTYFISATEKANPGEPGDAKLPVHTGWIVGLPKWRHQGIVTTRRQVMAAPPKEEGS